MFMYTRLMLVLRFNVQYAQDLYAQQPAHNSPGVWKSVYHSTTCHGNTNVCSIAALSIDRWKGSYMPSPHSTSQPSVAIFLALLPSWATSLYGSPPLPLSHRIISFSARCGKLDFPPMSFSFYPAMQNLSPALSSPTVISPVSTTQAARPSSAPCTGK